MSPVLRAASYAAIVFCAASAAVQAVPSFATGTTTTPASAVEIVKNDPLIIDANAETTAEVPEVEAEPRTLSALVAAEPTGEDLTAELECLAGAVYFEARSESLDGQLAVADVILNRADSGRFASTVCGVVHQPGQFSFVRGGRMPTINRNSQDWREAVAIARIAEKDRWESAASDALFFHATHVSPRWKLRRIATVGNHVFYR
ncbi:cell wall hydrolase [Sphingomonas colocasiae]|uniref:Cell wall hydrolase n=1 Tax=Sphingomonas colocasiae TaxID=1848973 RepID=A0ABS7PTN8_9SPHN|nr:cell wall hydrolase [Sphingomonas colocasiae]MBY8824711.1 cell wall hydrolase [Sphingomonas colocasiae]